MNQSTKTNDKPHGCDNCQLQTAAPIDETLANGLLARLGLRLCRNCQSFLCYVYAEGKRQGAEWGE